MLWVIDSFWPERLSRVLRRRIFDHVFITTDEDVDAWERLTGSPTTSLPWGSDVLGLGSDGPDRPVDLQRVGRQPPEWADDELVGRKLRSANLIFQGRPTMGEDGNRNQVLNLGAYRSAKYTLAFSNTVDGSGYTHPTRGYLTGRWTDSLAAGCVVAGIAPSSRTVDRVLWPGACLDLGGVGIEQGMQVLRKAVDAWKPSMAAHNHQMALRRLDWRWRFREIASTLGVVSDPLQRELDLLQSRIQSFDEKH